MQLVETAHIKIPDNRQRRTIAAATLNDLAMSIASRGLLHPPVVRRLDDETFQLVAGERRLRAIRDLQSNGIIFFCDGEEVVPSKCPVTFLHDLSPLDLREAELEENILRVDLTWQERATALADLHAMRKALNPAQTALATAEEISKVSGTPVATARQELAHANLVAQHLDNPAVAAARSAREAYKIVTSQLAAEFTADLHAAVGVQSPHTLIEGDLRILLPAEQVGSVDVIIVDPPYGMGADSFGTAGPTHTYKDTAAGSLELAFFIMDVGYRIAKTLAHLYMFCDPEHFQTLRGIAERTGWTPWRTPLIWDKGAGRGHNPVPAQAIRRTYEFILYAHKGNRPGNHLIPDILREANPSTPEHAAAKPAEIYRLLLARSVRPGDRILDPCCGTGPIFTAADALKVAAVGFEIDPSFAKLARAKLGGTP